MHDKIIINGCSRRRPDLLLDMGSHIIIVEVDENKHQGYECICENKRLMELSQDLQHRSIVFIRFNPDEYIDLYGNKIESCWKTNAFGITVIQHSVNWENRLVKLIDEIKYWTESKSDKMVEIVELFY